MTVTFVKFTFLKIIILYNNNKHLTKLICLKKSEVIQEAENNLNIIVCEWYYRNHALYNDV